MNKKIYSTGFTLALTSLCAVSPAVAADETLSSSLVDSQNGNPLQHGNSLQQNQGRSPLALSPLPEEKEEDFEQLSHFVQPSFSSEALPQLATQVVQLSTESDIEIQPLETKPAEVVEHNIDLSTVPAFAPVEQSITKVQASETETSHAFDHSAPLLAIASEPARELEIESPATELEKVVEHDINRPTAPALTPIAQSIPNPQPLIAEPPETFDNGASLLLPLALDPTTEPTPQAAQPSSNVDSAAMPAADPVLQSALDKPSLTPKSSEILDNYGLVNSVKNNKISVRLLNGKNKTYAIASNAIDKNIRRGSLMGFNTDRQGRITRLSPPEVQKVYQGTLIIVEGTKIGMVTPEGERFITTLAKEKIARMGLAPGQPIKITQYRGTWATKVCRPGILSDRQISPNAMQRQKQFLRGEASPIS
jgi:hypothetical protein